MRPLFVKTSNVDRFLGAIADVEDRGAPEASIMLCGGEAGYGKSRTAEWWALHNNGVHVRVKAACTPHWVLGEVVRELGEQAPEHSCEKLFGQAYGTLLRDPRPLVIDEVEHCLKNDIRALEILRDLSDETEIPLVLVGRQHVRGALTKHRQLYTRISGYAEFAPVTLADVALCVEQLCEVPVADEVVAEIHAQSEGHIRLVVCGIKNVERLGKRTKGTVTSATVGDKLLCQEWAKSAKPAKSRQAA